MDRSLLGLPPTIAACLFDLDGVITKTAVVHAAAWKAMFDAYLEKRAETTGEAFRPFDDVADYDEYVDGKPREEGVRSIAFGELRKVDPVHVVRRHANHPRVARPHRRGVVPGAREENAGAHTLLHRRVVVELWHADREVDAVHRLLQSEINGRRGGRPGANLPAPHLVETLLLVNAGPRAVGEAPEQVEADYQAREPDQAQRMRLLRTP